MRRNCKNCDYIIDRDNRNYCNKIKELVNIGFASLAIRDINIFYCSLHKDKTYSIDELTREDMRILHLVLDYSLIQDFDKETRDRAIVMIQKIHDAVTCRKGIE